MLKTGNKKNVALFEGDSVLCAQKLKYNNSHDFFISQRLYLIPNLSNMNQSYSILQKFKLIQMFIKQKGAFVSSEIELEVEVEISEGRFLAMDYVHLAEEFII